MRVTSTFFRRVSDASSNTLSTQLQRIGSNRLTDAEEALHSDGHATDGDGEPLEEILAHGFASDEGGRVDLEKCQLPEQPAAVPAAAGDGSSTTSFDAKLLAGDESEASNVCWICYEGPREAVLMECGHGGVCYECAKRIYRKKGRLCPICRQRITSVCHLVPSDQLIPSSMVRVRMAEMV